jgi:hypothetical protein
LALSVISAQAARRAPERGNYPARVETTEATLYDRSRLLPSPQRNRGSNVVARKLRTYTTSAGFFDLAVAAPSMKAALEAWGAESNLFHQGFATQSEDPAIIAATMTKPGLVLRRPVGTNVAFREHADLPTHLGSGDIHRAAPRRQTKPQKPAKPIDAKTARAAALAFEREQKRRERQSLRQEVAREKERKRRERAIETAQAALDDTKRAHQSILDDIEKARRALDARESTEAARWKKKEAELERALRQARTAR